MPMYDFRCCDCGAERELLVALADANAMELVCTGCGGEMRKIPPRVAGLRIRPESQQAATAAKARANACSHGHSCRCGGVQLTKPNPFRKKIEAELKPSGTE
jgi:putative FmdB family regulatory protein